MTIKELLTKQAEQATAVAKALAEGDMGVAVDLLKSNAEELQELAKNVEDETPAEETPTEETPEGWEEAEETPETTPEETPEETPAEETPAEAVEKTVTLTKTEADALAVLKTVPTEQLQKWADLWIGWSDLWDILEQLAWAKEALAKFEKMSKQAPEWSAPVQKSSLEWVLSVG